MEYSPLIAPVVALVAWTIIIMLWMMVSRFGEFRKLVNAVFIDVEVPTKNWQPNANFAFEIAKNECSAK